MTKHTVMHVAVTARSYHNHGFLGVARPVLVVPWIVIQELDSLKVHNLIM